MRIVNMAHGTLYAVGAYITAWLMGKAIAVGVPLGWLFLLLPVGDTGGARVRFGIEPLLLRAVYRSGGLRCPGYDLVVVGIGVLAAIGLWAGIYKTKFGVMSRAASQDRRMGSALGINVRS